MKKLLTLIAVSALGFTARAQTEAGKMVIGGSVMFSSSKGDQYDQKASALQVVPSIGYFVSKNLAIGTEIGYSYSKNEQRILDIDNNLLNIVKTKNQGAVVRPFSRYYIGVTNQFKFFGHLEVPMYFGNLQSAGNDNNYVKLSTQRTIGIGLSPGFVFFPIPKLGIEFLFNGINYAKNKYKSASDESITSNTASFNIGTNFLAPRIGVQYYF